MRIALIIDDNNTKMVRDRLTTDAATRSMGPSSNVIEEETFEGALFNWFQ